MSTVNFSDISGFGRWSAASSPSAAPSHRETGSLCGANDDEPRFETPSTVASSERLARLSGGVPAGVVEWDRAENVGPDDLDLRDLSLYDDYCLRGRRSEGSNGHNSLSFSGGSNGRMPDGGPHGSPAASECKEEESDGGEYYDDYGGLEFGDETMRLLAHAEGRLGGAPNANAGGAFGGGGGGGGSPPSKFEDVEGCSPISGGSGGSLSYGDRGDGMNDGPTSSAELHEMYRVNQRTASDDHAPIGPSLRHHPDEEVDEGESSLLRGPIMAARSAVSFAGGSDGGDEGGNEDANSGSEYDGRENLAGLKTPSKARAEQEMNTAGITPSRARSGEQYEPWNGETRPNHGATPSRERAEQETNAAGSTPSLARAGAVYELPPSGRGHAAVATPSMLRRETTTPARGPSRPPLQPLRTAEAAEPETPSNQRRAFLASPQDSVSTMGTASPTATAALAHGRYAAMTPSALQETLLSGAAESASAAGRFGGGGLRVRPRLTNNGLKTDGKENDSPAVPQTIQRAAENVRIHSQEEARQQQHQHRPPLESVRRSRDLPHLMASPISAPEYPGETPLSIEQSGPEALGPANEEEEEEVENPRDGGGRRRPRGSFDSMLERGEEQMRLGAADHTRAAGQSEAGRATPTGMEVGGGGFDETPVGGRGRGRRLLNKTEFGRPGAAPPAAREKRPFLKRGSRREPSSLHRLGMTPGGVRRSQSPGGAASPAAASADPSFATPASNGASAASATPASAVSDGIESAQRARLARLERMQADCLADLERRQARREEAARARAEREEEREKRAGARGRETPSRARAKSAAKGTPAARGGATTPSRARPTTATKTGRGEMTPSRARPTTAVKSKRADGTPGSAERGNKPWNYGNAPSAAASDYGRTPSAVRTAASSRKNYSVARRSLVERLRGGAGTPRRPASEGGTAVEIRGGDGGDDEEGLKDGVESGEDVEREGRDAEEGDVSDDEDSPGGNDSDVEDICRRYQSDSEAEERAPEDEDHRPEVSARGSRGGKTGPKARSASTPKRRAAAPAPASRVAFGRLDRSAPATRASSTGRPGGKRTPRSSRRVERDDGAADGGAFVEELERKKEEQMALIKNMRRRQEAALREAEGERERARAWAASERASVQRWADEQRAAIKKDRHKAANAAMLASKQAERDRRRAEEDGTEAEALREELDAAKREMNKLRAEAVEGRRLRETIRKQERTIQALRSQQQEAASRAVSREKEAQVGAGPGSNTPKTRASADPPRRVALGDASARHNQVPDPSSAIKRQPSAGGAVEPQQPPRQPPGGTATVVEEGNVTFDDTLTEEPTEHWLQRHLAKLNSANDRLRAKVEEDPNVGDEGAALRADGDRPYDATNYGGARGGRPAGEPLETPVPAPSPSNGNDRPSQTRRTSHVHTYKNGTRKEVLEDGTTTISFPNGDRKRTYANEKEGIVVYYYAETKTTQVTHQDGMQTYHFPNKQIENHYVDGRKEVTFPDGTVRWILDGTSRVDYAADAAQQQIMMQG